MGRPVSLPYALPFIGHALWFVDKTPGSFWQRLESHKTEAKAMTLSLFGQRIHIVRSAMAANKLLRLNQLDHIEFGARALEKVFGLDSSDIASFKVHFGELKQIFQSYLLHQEPANDLWRQFLQWMSKELAEQKTPAEDVGLSSWASDRVFNASTTAVFGELLLDTCPQIGHDMVVFESGLTPLYAGLPRFMIPDAYRARHDIQDGLSRWYSRLSSSPDEKLPGPEMGFWDSKLGSGIARAQRLWCRKHGFSRRGTIGMDFGLLLALSTNAIPAVIWMLMYILASEGDDAVLPKVMEELALVQSDDGQILLPKLMALPLLNSIFFEVLRLYIDLVLLRRLDDTVTLPVDETEQVVLEKGIVMCPVWSIHRDGQSLSRPPAADFMASRHVRVDPGSGKPAFAPSAAGQLLSFGCGKVLCPGRIFAKQEVLSAVASILLAYDIEFVGFVDEKGNPSSTFPRPAPAFIGSGVVWPGGDMKVNMKPRAR